MKQNISAFYGIVLTLALVPLLGLGGEESGHLRGAEIYQRLCVECHGEQGQGVTGKYEKPLAGEESAKYLARVIHRSMPEEEPEQCEDEDAIAVANYVYETFYSPEARVHQEQARIEFSRLTVRQYEEVIADLLGGFSGGVSTVPAERGLEADYYHSRRFSRKDWAFEQIDPVIDFDYGAGSADPEYREAEEFSIQWRGSVIAPETGEYEFIVKTENGFRLWVNSDDQPLIDGWVASGGEPKEHRESLRLLGGRIYPIRLDYFKYQDKTASVELRWEAPHRPEEIIPERYLTPKRSERTFVVTTPFPPDDSSVGYPRGTSVSKAWDEATTYAAIEVGREVIERLDKLSSSRPEQENRESKVKQFCREFLERAFRRPLTEQEEDFFIETQFEKTDRIEPAVKRVVLLALKSPRFLYPSLDGLVGDDYSVASRLSFGLWDSIPDEELLRAAEQERLHTEEQIANQARRMLDDPRTQAKVRDFFHHWLGLHEAGEPSKDREAFPGFDKALVADLRASLDLFIDQVVWEENSDYRDLLLSDGIFLNDRLADFYDASRPAIPGFEWMAFQPNKRSGVITHPYLLAAYAYSDSTSPIHRGVFLTRKILGRTLHPPPEAVAFKDSEFDPDLTMREKVADLTKPASCQNCHSIINPLGFSLEHFDSVGRFQSREKGKAIDATGEYPALDGSTVALNGARDVARYAASSPQAQEGFIIQLFNLMIKQPVQAYGEGTLEQLHRAFAGSEYRVQELLIEIAKVAALHDSQSKFPSGTKQLTSASP